MSINTVNLEKPHCVVAVIPAYKVSKFICNLIYKLENYVSKIIVVDDCCPEESGKIVKATFIDNTKVEVVFHEVNQGVGGAMVSGYQRALDLGATIVVKLDGDGQMDPALIPGLIDPIVNRRADYTKGNRFFSIESLKSMPPLRVFGNSVLSFLSKFSHGYWNIMDPTNGFIAIHAAVLSHIPLEKLEKRYFFENDMLFRLGTLRAVVFDVPMDSLYGDEVSSLNIPKVIKEFPPKFIVRLFKRIFYNYFLRDFTACSLELIMGILLLSFGFIFGIDKWIENYQAGVAASAGTVMLAGLPVLVGLNLLIAALSYDISNIPTEPLQRILNKKHKK